jgi:hypothetical protein
LRGSAGFTPASQSSVEDDVCSRKPENLKDRKKLVSKIYWRAKQKSNSSLANATLRRAHSIPWKFSSPGTIHVRFGKLP